MADPIELGGSSAAGAGIVALAIRLFFGSTLTDLKEKMSELKEEVGDKLTRMEDIMQRQADKQELHGHNLTLLEARVAAAHQRLDVIERDVRAIEDRCMMELKRG